MSSNDVYSKSLINVRALKESWQNIPKIKSDLSWPYRQLARKDFAKCRTAYMVYTKIFAHTA